MIKSIFLGVLLFGSSAFAFEPLTAAGADALEQTRNNLRLARAVRDINIDSSIAIQDQQFAGYCALGNRTINFKDVARLSFGRHYTRGNEATKNRIEEALASRFAEMFALDISLLLDRHFDWDEAEVSSKQFRRDRNRVPGFEVKVTIYQLIEENSRNKKTNPFSLTFVFAEGEVDTSKMLIADMVFQSFRVSKFFAAAKNDIDNGRSTLDETLSEWENDYPMCPDDLAAYDKYLDSL